jgi:2-aminoethylphosphonate-pyruvate transaminase
VYIVDAMSSFGGIPLSMEGLGAEFLISSANKCLQGTPGFCVVLARRSSLEACEGRARSLSLDLFDQWREMERGDGKWRYTSPTHVVRALVQAVAELAAEGGVAARCARYTENQRVLSEGYRAIGFRLLVDPAVQSPIITAFRHPPDAKFTFAGLYAGLKRRRFVIYPGKVSRAETFRVGNIGHVFPADMEQLVAATREAVTELGVQKWSE